MENKVYQVNAGGNIYDIDDRQADIDAAQLRQDLIAERERAELAEQQLQQDKQSVVKIVWDEYAHIDQFITPGIYDITGERLTTNDGLPIANAAPGHTIAARLTVLSSSIKGDGAEDDKCITQMLVLSNRTGGDGKVYIRTGRASTVDMLAGGVGWKPWSQLQQNIEVGAVATYDNLVDNGIYSGVYVGTGSKETFVLVVINDYALATQLGVARRVSQFKYSAYTGSNVVAYHSRVWDGNAWSAWAIINAREIESMINAEVAKLTNVDVDLIGRIQTLALWVEEHGVEAAQLTAAITTETERAQQAEGELSAAITLNHEDIGKEYDRAMNAENKIKSDAMQYNTLGVNVYADKAEIYGRSINAEPRVAEFPAATTDRAGVMSAQDKTFLESVPNAIEEGEKRALRRLFIAAGAEYNDTDQIIQKTAPWKTEEKWRLEDDGTYTYWEEPAIVDHLPKHYYLHGLGDITEQEMIKIYNAGYCNEADTNPLGYVSWRTNLGRRGRFNTSLTNDDFAMSANELQYAWLSINSQMVGILFSIGKNAFAQSPKLRKIICASLSLNAAKLNAFAGCSGFEEVANSTNNITTVSFNFADSPKIYKRWILKMINGGEPKSAITITLHPDAYARISNQPDIIEALNAQPLITLVSA